jgi:hypothetical protein
MVLALVSAVSLGERNERSLENLAKASKVIVVGTASNIHTRMTNGTKIAFSRIIVQEMLKGPATNNIPVSWTVAPVMENVSDFTPRVATPSIWLLWRSSKNGFELTFPEEVQPTNSIEAVKRAIGDATR